MSPAEELGRRLVGEMATFLRESDCGPEAVVHLDALTRIIRAKVFRASVSGEGHITVDLKMIFGDKPMETMQEAIDGRKEK